MMTSWRCSKCDEIDRNFDRNNLRFVMVRGVWRPVHVECPARSAPARVRRVIRIGKQADGTQVI